MIKTINDDGVEEWILRATEKAEINAPCLAANDLLSQKYDALHEKYLILVNLATEIKRENEKYKREDFHLRVDKLEQAVFNATTNLVVEPESVEEIELIT